MSEVEISRTCTIDAGHRVTNHNSKCRSVHGHNYRIELFAKGPLQTEGSSEGMVCDFSFLKILLGEIDRIFDHSFIMWCDDAAMKMASGINEKEIDVHKLGLLGYQEMVTLFGKVAVVPTVPTAENLAAIWLNICRNYLDDSSEYKHLKDTFTLTRMKVWETPNSCVEVS